MQATKYRAFIIFSALFSFTALAVSFSQDVQSQQSDLYRNYLPALTHNPDWELQCIDCDHKVFDNLGPRSADLDSDGQPHIVYGGEHLYHAYLTKDGVWEIETVDVTQNVGSKATLALDSADHPHIIYQGEEPHYYRYAYHDGANWHIEDLSDFIYPSNNPSHYDVSLDVDSTGRPHITYILSRTGRKHLMYAFRDGGDWHIDSIIDRESLGYNLLVMDSMDRPHILTAASIYMIYARFNGSIWEFDNVPSPGSLPSMALDSNDNPHIAVKQYDVLEYRHKDESGWHYEVVADREGYFCEDIGIRPSLIIDELDTPHISYNAYRAGPYGDCDPYISPFYHAYRSQSGWFSSQIGLANTDSYSTIVVDSPSNVHIFTKFEGELRHWPGSETTIDLSRSFGSHISIITDASDRPHVSYFEKESFRYHMATPITEAWSIRPLDSPGRRNSTACHDCRLSLAMGPDNALQMIYQTSYRSRFQPYWAVRHKSFRNSSEYDNLLTACANPTCFGFIDVDSQSRTHVVVFNVSSNDYWLGEYDEISNGYSWMREDIDILHQVAATAIDSADRLVVAGPSFLNTGVIVAKKTGSGWISETVTDLYWLKDMALDPDGMPHFIVGSERLRAEFYLYFDGTTWQEEPLDIRAIDVCDPGIVIDSDYSVHVAYVSASHKIMYVYRGESGWQAPVELDAGDACSLALDSAGRPFIAFRGGGDLNIVHKVKNSN